MVAWWHGGRRAYRSVGRWVELFCREAAPTPPAPPPPAEPRREGDDAVSEPHGGRARRLVYTERATTW